jgi:ArsR family transcriptional regulator, cadmium/lead-responsive transcriptional repressor
MSRGADAPELWAAVADPTRRRIISDLLARGQASATTLAGGLPVTRQAVTKQLAVLDRAGLVERRRSGREVNYSVRPVQLRAASRALVEVATEWDERLSSIKQIAERVARERRASVYRSAPPTRRAKRPLRPR